jgi:hypothetical protein
VFLSKPPLYVFWFLVPVPVLAPPVHRWTGVGLVVRAIGWAGDWMGWE